MTLGYPPDGMILESKVKVRVMGCKNILKAIEWSASVMHSMLSL